MNANAVMRDILAVVRIVLDFRLFDLGDRPVTTSTVLIVLLVLGIAWRFSRFAQGRLAKALQERGLADEGGVAVSTRLAHYAIMVMGLGIGLETAGVDLSALFAASAIFAIGIGFAVQNVAQNFVSGLILMFEGAIKPGHLLKVNGEIVRVSSMGIRSTIAVNQDDIELLIPNSELVTSTVSNLSMSNRLMRIRVNVGVAYESDLAVVHAALTRAANEYQDRSHEREPVVIVTDFGSSSVDFQASVWTDDPWRDRRVASGLRMAMWDALKEAGVTIAFPQMDLHLDEEVVTRIGRPAA